MITAAKAELFNAPTPEPPGVDDGSDPELEPDPEPEPEPEPELESGLLVALELLLSAELFFFDDIPTPSPTPKPTSRASNSAAPIYNHLCFRLLLWFVTPSASTGLSTACFSDVKGSSCDFFCGDNGLS